MAYQVLQIKDIFVGSIDAKDDVTSLLDQDEFIENFLIPPNFEIEEFLSGRKCFIQGYKGTGKTALLHYISKCTESKHAKNMFILFKSDYKNLDKNKMVNLAIQGIGMEDKDSLTEELDFEYMWRWIILNNIVQLNIKSNYHLFEKDKQWDKLEKVIGQLTQNNHVKSVFDLLPFKVSKIQSLEYRVEMPNEDVIRSLGIEGIELDSKGKTKIEFSKVLESAMELLDKLTPTSNNGYLFIDELEAFYEEKKIFERDLRMIRDLILSVKFYNDLFLKLGIKNIKIISAVRTEVLESIQKYVAGKEVNKVIYSFRQELKWNYANTNAYQHPIIQIWINRIKRAEIKHNQRELKDDEVMKEWFVPKIDSEDIVPYILDNSWHKPRDIVRYLQAASNVRADSKKYDQDVFSSLRKEYSKESWKEIFEELNIIYTPKQIERIKEFLMCYKRFFTFEEARIRSAKLSAQNGDSFLEENITDILKNLYSVGAVGNMSTDKRYYRWQHKGDDSLVIDDSKLYLFVHSGLWSELSLFHVHIDDSIRNNLVIGQEVVCRVKRLNRSFAYVDILDTSMEGAIHIKDLTEEKRYIKDINDVVKLDEVFPAKIDRIDNKFGLQLVRIFR